MPIEVIETPILIPLLKWVSRENGAHLIRERLEEPLTYDAIHAMVELARQRWGVSCHLATVRISPATLRALTTALVSEASCAVPAPIAARGYDPASPATTGLGWLVAFDPVLDDDTLVEYVFVSGY